LNRRRFLKYAGGTAAAVGASVLGVNLVEKQMSPGQTNTEQSTGVTTSKLELPPFAKFQSRPQFINPTDQQAIEFINLSWDADGDPLTYEWLIDNRPVSTQKDFSTKLPVGLHLVQLNVSDGTTKSTATNIVTVEPDQIYPSGQLKVRYKGVNYWTPSFKTTDQIDEELDTIQKELGCNAIILFGEHPAEEILIQGVKFAVEKDYERVYVSPRFIDATIEEAIAGTGNFAWKVRQLRDMSEKIVLVAGHELGADIRGIIPGDTYLERSVYIATHDDWVELVGAKFPDFLARIMEICKENYGYPVAYQASAAEYKLVNWSDPIFESVGVDAYISGGSNGDVLALSGLKRFRKPVLSTEWGCMTYTGSGGVAGIAQVYEEKNPYDEDEQANYIRKYCETLNKIGIDGSFYTIYNDNDPKGFGLLNGTKRKKGFYMYKSYQKAS